MAVPVSGVDPHVLPVIDMALCTQCATCAGVCPTGTLVWEQGALRVEPNTAFGCIACGQCMAACPSFAVTVDGRGISAADMVALPAPDQCATAAQFDALALSRRSIRHFAPRAVEPEVVQRLLDAAAAAPMGIPPSPVHIVVVQGAQQVQEYAVALDAVFKASRPFFSPLMLGLMRSMLGAAGYALMRDFVRPLYDTLVAARARGEDALFHNAPLALQFHVTPYGDVQDCAIAATYVMLAAQASGLGTCLIGSVAPMLSHNKALMAKYGIPPRHKLGLALIAGYPAVEYQRAIRRKLGGVHYA